VTTYTKITGNIKIYINGYLDKTSPVGGGLAVTSYPVVIGNNSLNTRQFDGFIDDVKIYNRVLNVEEISGLYTMRKADYGL
jgi:hypothetical protein